MIKILQKFILLLTCFFYSSCEEKIDLDIPSANSKIVVYGIIENDLPPFVLLTQSFDFFNNIDSSLVAASFINGAEVSYTVDGRTFEMQEYQVFQNGFSVNAYGPKPIDSINILGNIIPIFDSLQFGIIGKTYDLKIDIDGKILEWVIGGVMVFMLIMTIFKPKTQISPNLILSKKRKVINFIIFVIVGFYGGFVQAGIGILLIVALSRTKFSLIRANAVKMLIIFAYTVPVFLIFVYHGQVEWFLAAWLALGQVIGTWIAAKFAVGNPKINQVVRWVLIAMMIITIIKMFHLWEYFMQFV